MNRLPTVADVSRAVIRDPAILEIDDSHLPARIRQGQRPAFEILVQRYKRPLAAYLCCRVRMITPLHTSSQIAVGSGMEYPSNWIRA